MSDLWLMRHAKSAYPPGVDDHDRPLNNRGRRNARVAAEFLKAQPIEAVLVSSAVRAQQTWDIIEPFLELRALTVPELYDSHTDTIAEVIDANAGPRTLLIAHNPGLEDYVLTRAEPGTNLEAWNALRAKFPTSAIAHLRAGLLIDFVVPR